MKCMKAAGILAVAVTIGAPLTGGAQASRHERAMMEVTKDDRLRVVRELNRLPPKRVRWGQEKGARAGTVIVLEEPLGKVEGTFDVEVELFISFIDNGGRHNIGWRNLSTTIWKWFGSVLKAGVPAAIHVQHVGSGPYLEPEWDDARRQYQEIAMGWGELVWTRDGPRHRRADANLKALFDRRDKNERLATREAARKFLEAEGLPVEEWEASLGQPDVIEGMREADRRWAAIAVQGSKRYRRAFEAIPDPVILINGKYLITSNTAARHGGKRIESVYRLANRVVRREWEKGQAARRERIKEDINDLEMTEIAYGMEEGAAPERVMDLERTDPEVQSGTVLVEWLHSGRTELGRKLKAKMRALSSGLPAHVVFIEREARQRATEVKVRKINPEYDSKELMTGRFFWQDPIVLVNANLDALGVAPSNSVRFRDAGSARSRRRGACLRICLR